MSQVSPLQQWLKNGTRIVWVLGFCILLDFDPMTLVLKMQAPFLYVLAYLKNGHWIKVK